MHNRNLRRKKRGHKKYMNNTQKLPKSDERQNYTIQEAQ